MRFSLTSLVRLIGFMALASSAAAVGLSRALPEPSRVRRPAPPRYFGVNGGTLTPPSTRDYLIDAQTGSIAPVEFGRGVRLEFATCSPWSDGAGGVDLAGRAVSRTGTEHASLCDGSGLARFSLAARELSARATEGPVISGRPSWVPGSPSRMIFPAGDGRLYAQDVADDGSGVVFDHGSDPSELDPGSAARPIAWDCPTPGDGPPIHGDPVCPPIPALGGRLFVSLSVGEERDGRRVYGPWRLWWLKLDPTGARVVDAGRLIRPDDSTGGDAGLVDERLPSFTVTPDGRVAVAYLSRDRRESLWKLRVAALAAGAGTAEPSAEAGEVRTVSDDCAVLTPPVSPDGRWVYAVSRSPVGRGVGSVPRYDLAAHLDAPESGEPPSRVAARRSPARPGESPGRVW